MKDSPQRSYHHGNLREDLIRAGLELIAEQGVKGLTLREIGGRLGVSRMAAYRHFPDKAALLAAIGEISFSRFGDALEAAIHSKAGHLERLEEMGVAYVRFAAENRAQFEVMFGGGAESVAMNERGYAVAARSFQILLDEVRAGQAAGALSGDDPVAVAHLIWATVHGISLLGLEGDAAGEARFTRQCCRSLCEGIADAPHV